MSFDRSVVEAVREQYKQKIMRAKAEAEQHCRIAEQTCPELREIRTTLADTGVRVFQSAFLGRDGLEDRVKKLREENNRLIARRRELLEEHGFADDYLDEVYECDCCKDTGYVNDELCECMKKALVREAYEHSGLGEALRFQRFDNFSMAVYSGVSDPKTGCSDRDLAETVFNAALKFSDRLGKELVEPLLFLGAPGSGKTHLSSAVASAVIESGFDVVYDTVQHIIDRFEEKAFRPTEESVSFVERCMNCELLIIDDLGTERKCTFSGATLFDIVNTRLNEGRAMIINSNLREKAAFVQQYDERILSRLFGCFRVYRFPNCDVRRILHGVGTEQK